ncbi:GNAT family N-acetyltransferase [Nocardioides dongxiaopingii]|uniref:GNAT family N-acetyltransferase n=1 Tax=Nocardioides sp. S-1144 TaxID=2582905 RepID=UPI0011623DE5|nr:GNAT family N-acetyltransferase [Nocardioides sp. S-1144]QDH11223.1 GNAT family N-acetyltransferase [Nocardioides sp. S-1144]
MTRRMVRLTPDRLEALGQAGVPCHTCVRWELDPVRRARLDRTADPLAGAAAEKEAWLSHVLREWGSCGRVALVDDVPVGYVVYAPPAFVPGADAHPTAPVSPDAVLLTTAHVDPRHAGGGLGRALVQAMARDLLERGGIRAVEAFGDTRSRGRCVVSADFLARVGFKTHRAHPTTPRLRMELRSALTWREEVEAAVERLVGAVRPRTSPAPSLRDAETPDA